MGLRLRQDNPELWAEIIAVVREIVGDWTEDQIAEVMRKVRADPPDQLREAFDRVFAYCAAAQRIGDDEAIATIELWQMRDLPIVIFADENGVRHRLDVGDEQ